MVEFMENKWIWGIAIVGIIIFIIFAYRLVKCELRANTQMIPKKHCCS